jgi:hypothetical protein
MGARRFILLGPPGRGEGYAVGAPDRVPVGSAGVYG